MVRHLLVFALVAGCPATEAPDAWIPLDPVTSYDYASHQIIDQFAVTAAGTSP